MNGQRPAGAVGELAERLVEEIRRAAGLIAHAPRQVREDAETTAVEQATPAPDGDQCHETQRQGCNRRLPEPEHPLGQEPDRDAASDSAKDAG